MYQALDIFFFVFHTILTLFNVLGWIFARTRKWNLITLTLTALSWFVLGIWYGWGYCPCTDWHWDVRQKLGYEIESTSYIHFLVLELTGQYVSPQLADTLTGIVFAFSFVISITLNVIDFRKKSKPTI